MALFHVQLFRKPEWVRPEVNTLEYYVHLAILSAVALGLLQVVKGLNMFTWQNVLLSIPFLLAGDFVAHTLLQLQ